MYWRYFLFKITCTSPLALPSTFLFLVVSKPQNPIIFIISLSSAVLPAKSASVTTGRSPPPPAAVAERRVLDDPGASNALRSSSERDLKGGDCTGCIRKGLLLDQKRRISERNNKSLDRYGMWAEYNTRLFTWIAGTCPRCPDGVFGFRGFQSGLFPLVGISFGVCHVHAACLCLCPGPAALVMVNDP